MPKINLFALKMRELSQQIEMFCFHKRQKVVVEILWDRFSEKHRDMPVKERRDYLIDLIMSAAQKEIDHRESELLRALQDRGRMAP